MFLPQLAELTNLKNYGIITLYKLDIDIDFFFTLTATYKKICGGLFFV